MSIANIIIILVVGFVLYLYINDYIKNKIRSEKLGKEIGEIKNQRFAEADESIRQDLIDLDQALKEQQVVRHLTHCPKCFDLYFDDEPHKCKMFKGKIFNASPRGVELYPKQGPWKKPTDLSRYVDAGLVAAYNMIPSAGGVLVDISGNGNNVKFFNRILTEKEIIKIYKKSKWKTKMTSILRMLHPRNLLRSR